MVTTTIHEYNTSNSVFTVANHLDLGSINQANINTAIYPIVAGSNSYEKWFKLNFSGVITSISDVKFWKSSGTYVTGEILKYNGQVTTWATPTNSTSTHATSTIPTEEPASANVSIGGSLNGSLTGDGSTDFIVLQGNYSANTAAGNTNEKEFTFSWLES